MITVDNIVKTFRAKDGSVAAIDHVSFTVPEGAFFTLLGPSGCGKTTTMRCIAGLERPDSGTISIGGKVVYDGANGTFLPTAKRPIGMVFQSYAIWPHMTVFENVAYPLRVKRRPRAEIAKLVQEALELVGLGTQATRRAPQLSGGQQQRVALARALVAKPDVLILDEPLSNLDAAMRVQMRAELKSLQATLGLTTVYVTHDQQEALAMSDEIGVMQLGRLIQRGSPADIYHRPTARFSAEFVGATNLLPATSSSAVAQGVNLVHTAAGDLMATLTEDGPGLDGEFFVSLRPECVALDTEPLAGGHPIPATVDTVTFLGESTEYLLKAGPHSLRARRPSTEALRSVGEAVFLRPEAGGCVIIPADVRLEQPA